jgi:DNA-3-methyladenine glycosylase II
MLAGRIARPSAINTRCAINMAIRRSTRSKTIQSTPAKDDLSSATTNKGKKRQAASPVESKNEPSTPKRLKKIADLTPNTPASKPKLASKNKIKATGKGRAADPHVSNAILLSPETSRVVSYSDLVDKSKNDGISVTKPTTSTTDILGEACAHLIKVDSRMKPLIEKHTCHLFSPESLAEEVDPFRSLASGIIGQQVSGAAARSIKRKFVSLFDEAVLEDESLVNERFPKPSQVVDCSMERLRSAGLSGRKAEYIRGLAERFVNKEFSAEILLKASDEELMEKLIAVKGLGRWSVEMFLTFALKRLDIFSTTDLGVQ